MTPGGRLRAEELRDVLRYGDDSQFPTPGLFFYAHGMPVVVTRNQLPGLKLVNGASFRAVDIIPDLASGAIALASDVALHLGPPAELCIKYIKQTKPNQTQTNEVPHYQFNSKNEAQI